MMRGEEDWSFCLSGWNLHLSSSQFPIFQQGWISSATQAREATGAGIVEKVFLNQICSTMDRMNVLTFSLPCYNINLWKVSNNWNISSHESSEDPGDWDIRGQNFEI